jgi:nucleoside-diphosphate-sugar epimerase
MLADEPRDGERASDPARVVVTGSGGYIGGHVVAALRASRAEVVPLDRAAFGDAARRAQALVGADAVVHCVSAVSGDPAGIRAANVDAARAVADSCDVAGVGRVIAVSTAAVTGSGPHRGMPGDSASRPESAVSRARAEGEQVLLDAGATVVRPNLVWGAGDRWVVPTLARIMAGAGSVPGTWRARVSAVGVRDLADGLAGLATTAAPRSAGPRVLHADAPGAVPITTITDWIREHVLEPGMLIDAGQPLTEHQRSMLEVDNWFDGSAFWQAASVRAPRPFRPLGADAAWYRAFLGCGETARRFPTGPVAVPRGRPDREPSRGGQPSVGTAPVVGATCTVTDPDARNAPSCSSVAPSSVTSDHGRSIRVHQCDDATPSFDESAST